MAAALAAAVLAGVCVVLLARRDTASGQPHPTDADFVGSARCRSCHDAEYDAWTQSQHAMAMALPSNRTVEGRFDGTPFVENGVVSTFSRRGDRYVVRTEGPDSAMHDYEVAYSFGVWPLQQYLVPLSRGRLQALTTAWDARPVRDGGQRWFSLAPDSAVGPSDALHWSGRQYNWNYMCADCHSTRVRKGYVSAVDSFHTTFSEISVGCEGCHGPSRRHVRWGAYPAVVRAIWPDDGLPARLDERDGIRWSMPAGVRTAYRSTPRHSDREIEMCAQCHARRVHFADGYTAGARLLDYYMPSLIVSELYYPDGQQREEVYGYGSFLQSRMYAAGVTCADCHEPHSGKVRRPGNAVCTQCHRASAYDTSAHTFHRSGMSTRCVSCHMPTQTYMRIDARHDHSLRVPRPDLTVSFGVPNPCTGCHRDSTASWAAATLRTRYGHAPASFQRFAAAFAADDRHSRGAVDSLLRVATDATEPAIVRASAFERLADHADTTAAAAARHALADPSPLVRVAALRALETLSPMGRLRVAQPLLRDSIRAVRQQAAWMAAAAADSLNASGRAAFARAAAELAASQRYNGDRVVNRLTLATFFAQRRMLDSAEVELRAALRLDPSVTEAKQALDAVLRAREAVADAPHHP